ncbi:MAG: LiaI-LiaF-like domain-containing protein [Thermoanaerobaculia bacterium]
MSASQERRGRLPALTGRMILGGTLILFGLLFLLDNLGYLAASRVLQFWPLMLIAIGVWKVLQPREDGQRGLGVVLIAIGLFLQLQMLAVMDLEFRHVWPAVLIALGGLLLWRGVFQRSRPQPGGARLASSELHEMAFMGGGNRIIDSPDFRGGDLTAIMGGLELDLRKANMTSESAVVDVFALWGGIEMRVPPEWSVEVQGVAILGGIENNARASAVEGNPGRRLIIRGTVLMGGLEIKN